jgi:Ras-related protein Rab-14
MAAQQSHKYIFKYIIIGEAGVGKSSLTERFTRGTFTEKGPTVGVEFDKAIAEINNELVKLQIWDTAGQERFRSVTRGYYRGAAGALLVYDVTRRATFARVGSWLADARGNTSPQTVMMLIGNKADLEENREVTFEEAQAFAEENNLLFLECSAKNGDNVEQGFINTAKKIHEKVVTGVLSPTDPDSGVQLPSAGPTAGAAGVGKAGSGNGKKKKKDGCDC